MKLLNIEFLRKIIDFIRVRASHSNNLSRLKINAASTKLSENKELATSLSSYFQVFREIIVPWSAGVLTSSLILTFRVDPNYAIALGFSVFLVLWLPLRAKYRISEGKNASLPYGFATMTSNKSMTRQAGVQYLIAPDDEQFLREEITEFTIELRLNLRGTDASLIDKVSLVLICTFQPSHELDYNLRLGDISSKMISPTDGGKFRDIVKLLAIDDSRAILKNPHGYLYNYSVVITQESADNGFSKNVPLSGIEFNEELFGIFRHLLIQSNYASMNEHEVNVFIKQGDEVLGSSDKFSLLLDYLVDD